MSLITDVAPDLDLWFLDLKQAVTWSNSVPYFSEIEHPRRNYFDFTDTLTYDITAETNEREQVPHVASALG